MAGLTTSSTSTQSYKKYPLDAEDLEGYAPGGYCPVEIGDRLNSNSETYTVLHKLGYGPSSTVWLVRRDVDGSTESLFHALKILRADLSNDERRELNVMWRLEQLGWNCEAHPSLVQIQCWFPWPSPNGIHHCFVLPLLGPSLSNWQVILNVGKSNTRLGEVCEQLAHAVNYLHGFGICHSHLSESHILGKIPSLNRLNESQILHCLGPPVTVKVLIPNYKPPPSPSPHHPDFLTAPASFSGLRFSTITSIALVGFGNAFPELNPPPTLPDCPIFICPPEVLFGFQYTRKSDVWQLACMLYKIHSTWLFPFEDLEMTSYERLVWHMTRHLGPIPESWRGKYDTGRYKTVVAPPEEEGRHLEEWCDPSQPTQSLKSVFDNPLYSHITGREEVAKLVENMLVWEPEKRPTMGPVYAEAVRLWGGRRQVRERWQHEKARIREKEERQREERQRKWGEEEEHETFRGNVRAI